MSAQYEIYFQSARDRQWRLEAVFDNKAQALAEARAVLEEEGILRVQVVEEKVDSSGDVLSSTVVYQSTTTSLRSRGSGQRDQVLDPLRRNTAKRPAAHLTPQPSRREGDAFRYLTLMLMSISGIALALVGGMIYLLPYLG